jgi:hypothetical protein
MAENPKVFISHASEDKERFVLPFATRLRSKGVDAWVDRWEMVPGDSLVTKIFEEGIKNAQAVIVVISEHSINKKWVRAELNAGVVNRIEEVSKLIPVVLGDVDESKIPQSLKDTLWEPIKDLDNYDAAFESIVRSIYEQRERPELGDPPTYTRMKIDVISDLKEVDSLIFKVCCEAQAETGDLRALITTTEVSERTRVKDLPEEEVLETLEVLVNRGYLELTTSAEGNVLALTVTDYGFDQYARTYLPEYESLFRAVALEIVNYNRQTGDDVADALGRPPIIVEHIVRELDRMGYIKSQQFPGGLVYIHGPTTELKRWLRET